MRLEGAWKLPTVARGPALLRGGTIGQRSLGRLVAVADMLRYSGQVAAYAVFMIAVGYFSASPAYTHLDPSRALLKVSFSHAGQPVRECRRLSPEEIAKLAANMRRPDDCPRERVPLHLVVELDGKPLFEDKLSPTGLWGDGPSSVYQRFPLPSGRHRLNLRLRDSRREEGFDYESQLDLDLVPRQNLVVDFRPATGGFTVSGD